MPDSVPVFVFVCFYDSKAMGACAGNNHVYTPQGVYDTHILSAFWL